jgi:hypothetical protein
MHKIMNKKFYLSPKFGTLFNKSWITISELLHLASWIQFRAHTYTQNARILVAIYQFGCRMSNTKVSPRFATPHGPVFVSSVLCQEIFHTYSMKFAPMDASGASQWTVFRPGKSNAARLRDSNLSKLTECFCSYAINWDPAWVSGQLCLSPCKPS